MDFPHKVGHFSAPCQCHSRPNHFTRSVKVSDPTVLAKLNAIRELDDAVKDLEKRRQEIAKEIFDRTEALYPEVRSPNSITGQLLKFEGAHYYCVLDAEEGPR